MTHGKMAYNLPTTTETVNIQMFPDTNANLDSKKINCNFYFIILHAQLP